MTHDWTHFEDILQRAETYPGYHRQVTRRCLEDLVETVLSAEVPGDIVEVGIYRGGSAAVLAAAAKEIGARYHGIDVDPRAIEGTAGLLKELGLADVAELYQCDFAKFAARWRSDTPPVLVFVDGHHAYRHVAADIETLLKMDPLPQFAAFHDYSLRSVKDTQDAPRVRDALFDAFGPDFSHQGIGIRGPANAEPNDLGNFHEPGVREAALLPRDTFAPFHKPKRGGLGRLLRRG